MGAPPIGFDVVMRGFDRNQVQDAVGRLEDDLRMVVTERDQAITRANDLHVQLEQASSDVSTLNSKLRNAQAPTFESMGERIASMLRLAEEEAVEIRRQANADAEQTRTDAAADKEAVDQENIETRAAAEQNLNEAKAEADRLLAEAKAEAAQHTEDRHQEAAEHLANAKTEAADLTAQSAQARDEADKDFHITLVERRKQAQAEHQELDRSSKDESSSRVQNAKDVAATLLSTTKAQCASMVADARAEVEHIKTVRATVAQSLFDARQVLAGIPEELAELPDPEPSRELAEQRAAAQIDQQQAALGSPQSNQPEQVQQSDQSAEQIGDGTGEPARPADEAGDLPGVSDELIADEPPVDATDQTGAAADTDPSPEPVVEADASSASGRDEVFDVEAAGTNAPRSSVHPPNAVIPDEDEIPAAERTIQVNRARKPNPRIIDRKSGN